MNVKLPGTVYLLFAGSSPDGRGNPEYIGRTADAKEAGDHALACKKDPYSTGYVMVLTDFEFRPAKSVDLDFGSRCKRCKGPIEAHRPNAEHCCDCANIIYMCANRHQGRGPNDYFDDGLGE